MPADPALPLVPLLELLAAIRPVARHRGYAIALHGSQARDIDLVAIPWVPIVARPEELVEAIRQAVDGIILCADPAGRPGYLKHPDPRAQSPTPKPHGRMVWAIQLVGYGTYLDLSVMPPLAPANGPQA